jgi:hypothetical protein
MEFYLVQHKQNGYVVTEVESGYCAVQAEPYKTDKFRL